MSSPLTDSITLENANRSGHDDVKMPILGFGTWQSDKGLVGAAVKEAVKQGVRHIDCAAIYGNQEEIGQAFTDIFNNKDHAYNVSRKDLFIVSKLWCSEWYNPKAALERTLKQLNLTYLDLYLVHGPMDFAVEGKIEDDTDNKEPKDDFERMREGNVSIHDMWSNMEKLVDAGMTRSIGISNWPVMLIRELLSKSRSIPSIHQIEIHPYFNQDGSADFCKNKKIVITAYSPLANGRKDGPISDPKVIELAQKYSKGDKKVTPAQILIRYCIDKGLTVIPKSTTPERIRENIDVFHFKLTENEVEALGRLEKGMRTCDLGMFWGFPVYS